MTSITILTAADVHVLENAAPGVFDHSVRPSLAREFLADPRHHIAVAVTDGLVVGFASAVHYVHPDKPTELWINEVGVGDDHRRQGIATRLLKALFEHGREIGCGDAWILTHRSNEAAMGLYDSVGGSEAPEEVVMFSFRLGRE